MSTKTKSCFQVSQGIVYTQKTADVRLFNQLFKVPKINALNIYIRNPKRKILNQTQLEDTTKRFV